MDRRRICMINWPKKRSWGWYATLLRTPWLCIKILRFRKGGELSLQRHKYRNELWLFLGVIGCLNRRKYLFKHWGWHLIKKNRLHTFKAITKPAYIFEIQYGSLVSEDDITRYNITINRKNNEIRNNNNFSQ